MPFIHVRAYAGRDKQTQMNAAKAIADAASEAMNTPLTAFTVIYEEVDKEVWDAEIAQKEIAPRKDKILIDHGVPVE